MDRPAPSARWEFLAPVARAGLLAGLVEGVAIVGYDVGAFEPDAFGRSCAWLAAIGALSVALWCAPAVLLPARARPFDRLTVSFCVWLAVIAFGRAWLADRTQPGTWALLAAALAIFCVQARSARRGRAVTRIDASVALAAAASLLGRVPDADSPAATLAGFLGGAIALAWIGAELFARFPRTAAAALLAGAAFAPLVPGRAPAVAGPNVLFVLVDTLRADHVPPFGTLTEARAIEKLAAQGVRFDAAVTVVPKTPASVASFLTGRYPPGHGVRTLHDRLDRRLPTLPAAFAAAGYPTTAIVNNAWLNPVHGFGAGFDRFDGYFEVNAPYGPLRYVSWVVLADRLTRRRIQPFDGQTYDRVLTDRALDYLRDRKGRPFFLYVHYFEPHWPYFPPPALARRYGGPPDGNTDVNYVERTSVSRGQMIFQNPWPEEVNEAGRRLYRGEVHDTLDQVGRLVDGLDELGLGGDTIVVFTADHGHSLGDHHYYFHHGEFLYESSLRIPLVLRWPGHVPAGHVVREQVRSVDLAPTLLDLAGLPPLPGADGESLAPLWTASGGPDRSTYIESDVSMFAANTRRPVPGTRGKLRALRDGRFKLILTPEPNGAGLELYDLARDPQEANDLAGEPAERTRVSAMHRRLLQLMPEPERRALRDGGGGDAQAAPSASELELLRRLGYVESAALR